MDRRTLLSAVPGLTIGGIGTSAESLLNDTPETDWTALAGSQGVSPAKMRAIMKMVEEIEQWRRAHMGIDAFAAGSDYPHPSQKVRVLQFFEGNGRLDPSGIQFRVDPSIVGTYALWWVPEYYDSVILGSVAPYARISGDINETVADAFDTKIEMFAYAMATPITHSARLTVSAVDPLAVTSSTTSITGTVTNSGLISGSPFFELFIDDTDNRHFRLAAVPLYLAAETADFATLSDGMLWYRTDTDKFRARANGVTENLATESYVAAAIPTTMNKVPYAAKTTDYTTTAADGVITMDASGGARTVTLVTASGNSGLQQTIKKIDSSTNIVTIDANGSQTIDGVLTMGISLQWGWITVTSDGSNWLVTGRG